MHSDAAATDISRLVTVTHREPFHVIERDNERRVERTAGGLIAALEPAMRAMNGLWVSADVKGGAEERLSTMLEELPYHWQGVGYDDELYQGFYLGFSNRSVWPLFHSMLGVAEYHRRDWSAYVEVNRRFAAALIENVRERDFIWVHDYQLFLVPHYLREAELPADARVGFFLHIPFPPYDIFRTLPWAKEILQGMLGASLVGFHVAEYAANFFDCVEQILEIRCDRLRGRVQQGERYVHVRSIPIGIDAVAIHNQVRQPQTQERARQLHAEVGCETLIIGVDRLDYTKGIFERLSALETFFEKNPERRGQVSMIQVAVPSRGDIEAYRDLRELIERQVGHINGLYATPGWTPVTFMCRSVPFEELVALYHAGDIALVTPLRDGMNLVAKEYVAAHREGKGVLILSELAGAAQQLTEAELVNPYHVDGIAAAIARALLLPDDLKQRRMSKMNAKVTRYDVRHWVESFLAEALYVD
jgi:alpha,alpha-trehalose-phosphate synthase [UDP-forming]